MLLRFIFGYAPANLIVAISSFAGIYFFTRFLTPEEFGVYSIAVSVIFMSQAIFFYWLQVGATRFTAQAKDEAALTILASTIYKSFFISGALFIAAYILAVSLIPLSDLLRPALWLALPVILLKSLVLINQAFHRSELKVLRFTLVESLQSLLGLALAILLVSNTKLESSGILLGMILALLTAALLDLPSVFQRAKAMISRPQLKILLRFGLPLTVSYALNFVLSTSDRFLIQHFLGAFSVGIYSVSYGIADRALISLFIAVSMASFPLLIQRFEQDGEKAAAAQMNRNAIALLAVAIPATVGFIALQEYIAAVLIGDAFRLQALKIMPWVAVSTFLSGLQLHYFDHALHLVRRSDLFIWTLGPATLINLVLNILLLPSLGLIGAVYATAISYAISLGCTIAIARRLFPVPFPLQDALRITIASISMFFFLKFFTLTPNASSLVTLIILGGIWYAVAAIGLNIADARTKLAKRFLR